MSFTHYPHEAEKYLFNLGLKMEIMTGKRIDWKKGKAQQLELIAEAMSTDTKELCELAISFIIHLPEEDMKLFEAFLFWSNKNDAQPPAESSESSLTANLALRAKAINGQASAPQKRHMYRGQSY